VPTATQEDRSKLVYYVTQIKVEGYSEKVDEQVSTFIRRRLSPVCTTRL
jgi:hypothetical protein